MDDGRWYAYAQDKELPLPNIRNSTPAGKQQEEQKFTFKTSAGRSSEPLSTIKDEKSNSSIAESTSDVIEEHPEI